MKDCGLSPSLLMNEYPKASSVRASSGIVSPAKEAAAIMLLSPLNPALERGYKLAGDAPLLPADGSRLCNKTAAIELWIVSRRTTSIAISERGISGMYVLGGGGCWHGRVTKRDGIGLSLIGKNTNG